MPEREYQHLRAHKGKQPKKSINKESSEIVLPALDGSGISAAGLARPGMDMNGLSKAYGHPGPQAHKIPQDHEGV